MNTSRKSAIRTMKTVLSANLACSESDLISDGVSVRLAEIREGRFRFPFREQSLNIVTMGKGVVVSCSTERIEWAQRVLAPLSRGQLFSAQTIALLQERVYKDHQYIAGPDHKYICSHDDLKEFNVPQGIAISIVRGNDVAGLYGLTSFKHALSFRLDSPRPDMIAAVAECNREVVGIAGASADSGLMWQIGVDVAPGYQGRGIGKAIVGKLTRSVLEEGVTPYYSAVTSNLPSAQLAVSLGYWPAWIELYARDLT